MVNHNNLYIKYITRSDLPNQINHSYRDCFCGFIDLFGIIIQSVCKNNFIYKLYKNFTTYIKIISLIK